MDVDHVSECIVELSGTERHVDNPYISLPTSRDQPRRCFQDGAGGECPLDTAGNAESADDALFAGGGITRTHRETRH